MFFFASLSSFVFSCLCYIVMAPRFETAKQRSWIITFLSSCAMSIASLPFLQDFLMQKADLVAVQHRAQLARLMCGSFQGFLLSDLVVGNITYPQFVSPIYGWAHHTIYALLLPYITRRGWAHLFGLSLSMEIPTCLLASSFLWPRLRNDVVYVALFFATRIALHAALLLQSILPRSRNVVLGGSYLPSCLFMLAFIMHSSWFFSSAKGTIRRARANSRSQAKKNESGLKAPQTVRSSQELEVHIDSSVQLIYFQPNKVGSLDFSDSMEPKFS